MIFLKVPVLSSVSYIELERYPCVSSITLISCVITEASVWITVLLLIIEFEGFDFISHSLSSVFYFDVPYFQTLGLLLGVSCI